MKRKGWSVFWREDKRRWILARGGKQTIVPKEFGRTEREANRWAVEHMVSTGELAPNGGRRRPQKNACKPLFGEWIAFRKRNPEQWAEATVVANEQHCELHLVPAFGGDEIGRVTPESIRRWLELFRKNRASNTVRNVYRTLVAFLDWCIERGHLRENPARSSLVKRALPVPDETYDDVDLVISIEAAQCLIASDAVPLLRRVRYALAFTAPMRDGELAGLTFGSVDFLRGSIAIRQAARVKRKGMTSVIGRTKTRRSKRTVALHPCARAALLDWQRIGWAQLVGRAPTAEDPILPGRKASFSRQKVAPQLRADLEAVKAPSSVDGIDFVFHHTRGSVLNWLRDLGVEESIRSYLAGHTQKSTGGKHYERFPLEPLRRAVESIPLEWPGLAGRTCAVACAAVTREVSKTGTDGLDSPAISNSLGDGPRSSVRIERRFPKSQTVPSSERTRRPRPEKNRPPARVADGFGEQREAKTVTRSADQAAVLVTLGGQLAEREIADRLTGEGAAEEAILDALDGEELDR